MSENPIIQIILIESLMHFEHPLSLTRSYFNPSYSVQTEHKYEEYPFSQITGKYYSLVLFSGSK